MQPNLYDLTLQHPPETMPKPSIYVLWPPANNAGLRPGVTKFVYLNRQADFVELRISDMTPGFPIYEKVNGMWQMATREQYDQWVQTIKAGSDPPPGKQDRNWQPPLPGWYKR